MAQQTVGEALHISDDVIQKLREAQEHLDKLADSTEKFVNKTGADFVDMMNKMGQAARDNATKIGTAIGTDLTQNVGSLTNALGGAVAQINALSGSLSTINMAANSIQQAVAAAVAINQAAANLQTITNASNQVRYAWEGDLTAMMQATENMSGMTLAEMQALQRALMSEISKVATSAIQSNDPMAQSYRNVATQIKEIERALKGVASKQTSGTERTFDAITQSVDSADATVKSLMNDFSALREQMQNTQLDVEVDPRWNDFEDAMKRIIERMGEFRDSTVAQNEALQPMLNTMALYRREMSESGNASMGRFARGGVDEFRDSIESTSATLQSLKQDAADVRAVMERTAGGATSSEWERLAEVLKLAETRMEEFGAAAIQVQRQRRKKSDEIVTYNEAVTAADAAKSYKQLQEAIKKLNKVRSELDPEKDATKFEALTQKINDTKKKVNELKDKMGETSKQTKKAHKDLDGFAGLKSKLAQLFTISAAYGFLNKMVQIRAELNLQNIALRAILQNKDEADRIFGQVQQMALQSPYTIMQLTTYTKQLAAYHVEANRLVQTTKMLADVSAGLGVDMQRMILAYGQVKSANYLRATEVRQFTEAGLNITGELAKYLSELEGRMISVGDVMAMVSKRAIKFEYVEEVFKRITSAGGLFYDMQKKQSESIYGMIQRISDAYTIMMNDIGVSKDGTIKWTLGAIRSLISHWRALAPVIKACATAAVIFYTGHGIAALIGNVGKLTKAFSMAEAAINATTKAQLRMGQVQVITNWLALLAAAGMLIYSILSSTSALTEKLKEMNKEAVGDANEAVARFKMLADTLNDLNASYTEQKDALDEIKRAYSGIFSKQELEIENIRKMGLEWSETERRMREYYSRQLAEKRAQAIVDEGEKEINETIDEIVSNGRLFKNIPHYSKEIGRQILKGVLEEWKDGKIDDDRVATVFINRLLKSFGIDNPTFSQVEAVIKSMEGWGERTWKKLEKYQKNEGFIGGKLESIFKEWRKMQDQIAKENPTAIGTFNIQESEVNKALEADKEKLERLIQLAVELGRLQRQWQKENPGGVLIDPQTGQFPTEEMNKLYVEYTGLEKELYGTTTAMDVLSSSCQNHITISELAESTSLKLADSFETVGAKAHLANNGFGEITDSTKRFVTMATQDLKVGASEYGLSLREMMRQVGATYKVSVDIFEKAKGKIVTDDVTALRGEFERLKSLYEQVVKINRSNNSSDNKLSIIQQLTGDETEESLKAKTEALAALLLLLGYDVNKTTHSSGKDAWLERLELMKKVNSEYEKLLKYYNKDEAKRRVGLAFADAAAETFKGYSFSDISAWGGFDKAQTIANLREVLATAKNISKEARKQMLAEIGQLQSEIDIKVQEDSLDKLKRDIDELFANFDLTKTFSDLGLNTNLMEDLFGVKAIKNISDLRKQFEGIAKTTKVMDLLGDDWQKWYDDTTKKLDDMEAKQRQERVKNMLKYTKEAMGARGKIVMEAYQEQVKIMQNQDLDEPTRTLALQQNAKKMNDELAKQDWEDFKGSDAYIQMFEDMEYTSTKSIKAMLKKMQELKEGMKGLSPTQARTMVKEMERLEDQLRERNPFSVLVKSMKEVEALKKQGKTKSVLEDDLATQNTQKAAIEDEIFLLQTAIALKMTGAEATGLTAEQQKKVNEYAAEDTAYLNTALKAQESLLGTKNKEIKVTQEGLDTYKENVKNINAAKSKWAEYMQAAKKAYDLIKNCLEAMGVDMDSIGGIVADTTLNLIDMAGQLYFQIALWKALGAAVKESMGPIGWMLIALEATTTLLTGVFRIGDKKKQKQIDALKDKVDGLSNAYDKLKKNIENAYQMSAYRGNVEQAKQSIQDQIYAYQKMYSLEESKKKKDKSALKEYQEKIAELKEELEDLANEQTKAFGGFGTDGRLDAAQEFVDTWLDAFKESGDGLDALGDKWDEYIENLLKKQAAYRIVGSRMESFFNQVDEMANAHTELSMREILERLQGVKENILETANRELKEFFDYFGWTGGGDLLLSDLQKGIQSITEEQAAALESIVNSIRFGVYQQLDVLKDILAAVSKQYMVDDSPVVTELRAIKSLVGNIDRNLESVIRRTNSPDNRPYIRVN